MLNKETKQFAKFSPFYFKRLITCIYTAFRAKSIDYEGVR